MNQIRKFNVFGLSARRLSGLFMVIAFLLFASGELYSGVSYSRENPVVRAVRKVSPAVVNISSEYEVGSRLSPFSGLGMDSIFENFFNDFFDPGLQRRYKRTSLGSGVIISGAQGLILTNAHVISRSSTIQVVLQDKREFNADIIGADPDSDLAVLRIQSDEPLPAIDMGKSDDLMIGETIIAIGNPFGFSHTVTTGVISALNRSLRTEERTYQDFIQTDASINPGNSGGPLLNINGELIGINTAIYAKAQGIGFAIPINRARRIINDLILYGEVVLPWVGITAQEIDNHIASYMSLDAGEGLLVRSVELASPAHVAGITTGDVILDIGNQPMKTLEDYRAAIRSYKAGDTILLSVRHEGARKKSRSAPRCTLWTGAPIWHFVCSVSGFKIGNHRVRWLPTSAPNRICSVSVPVQEMSFARSIISRWKPLTTFFAL
ncbi:peptidase/PDZ domain protein [Olavius algarvensis associated proteobacterium Delta 3]|nr:peptidase/PDZ domain protein [Olavius algarvensis associated proteobacterium Delta 3]